MKKQPKINSFQPEIEEFEYREPLPGELDELDREIEELLRELSVGITGEVKENPQDLQCDFCGAWFSSEHGTDCPECGEHYLP